MTSPATSPFARVHRVPEAAHGLVAALAVLGADAAVMGIWWWSEQGMGSTTRTWLAGALAVVLVAIVLVTMARHPVARRTAVGAVAVAVVVDAIVIGYEMSGLLIP